MTYITPLTKTQLRVHDFIRDYASEHRTSPLLDEIAEHIGTSKVTAREHVQALKEKGYAAIEPRRARGITLVDPQETTLVRETMTLLRNIADRGASAGDQRVARILTRWRETGAVANA